MTCRAEWHVTRVRRLPAYVTYVNGAPTDCRQFARKQNAVRRASFLFAERRSAVRMAAVRFALFMHRAQAHRLRGKRRSAAGDGRSRCPLGVITPPSSLGVGYGHHLARRHMTDGGMRSRSLPRRYLTLLTGERRRVLSGAAKREETRSLSFL